MSTRARRSTITVFAVDDASVQLTWRDVRPGRLRLSFPDLGDRPDQVIDVDGGPGAALLEGLPAGRLLHLDASGTALGSENRRLRVRTLDRLPGEELYRLATISDLHLGARSFGHRGTIVERPPPTVPHPRRCAQAGLDEAVGWGAERVVVKGDVTNAGVADHWRQYATMVAGCAVPVDAVAGNHDNAHPLVPYSLTAHNAALAFDLSIAEPMLVRDLPGLRLVLADSTLPGRNTGSLGPTTDDVLDAVAQADPAGGVLLVLHHHLQPHRLAEGWPLGISHGESISLMDRLGRAHPHVVVTSGHTHRHRRWGHAGVVATQVGATKDFPGVWAGYTVYDGGLRQTVRRIARPDCLAWTDHTRRAALGLWGHIAIGRLDARCFNVAWSVTP